MIRLKISLSAVIIFISFACEVVDLDEIDNLFDGYVQVIGHGGSGFPSVSNPYPPNSLVAISRALDGGYVDGVEVDVQMTVDSVAVLFHDASLESSSNCTGFTQNFSFEELNNCRYRQSTHNERIISLETILNRYKNHLTEFFLFLDIKLYDHQDQYYAARLIRSLGRLFRNYPTFAEKMIIQSGSSAFLTQVQHEISGAVLMLKTDNFNDGYIVCSELGLNGLVITHKKINRAQVKQAHGLNLYIVLTDISSRGDAVNALRNNPDFVQTDNVSLMQKILN